MRNNTPIKNYSANLNLRIMYGVSLLVGAGCWALPFFMMTSEELYQPGGHNQATYKMLVAQGFSMSFFAVGGYGLVKSLFSNEEVPLSKFV